MIFLRQLFLLLFVIGPFISDRWLNNHLPGSGQSYFILPFIGLSLLKFKSDSPNNIKSTVLLYGFITLSYFIFGGLQGLQLLITILGGVMIFYIFTNKDILNEETYKTITNILLGVSIIMISTYYLGVLWEVRNSDLGNFRMTFMENNENLTAQIICIGICILFYKFFESPNFKYRLIFLIMAVLAIRPLMSTVSRTGLALCITIFILNLILFSRKTKNKGIVFLFTLIFISTIGLNFIIDEKSISLLNERIDGSEEDIRFELWDLGLKIANENMFSGIGFGNFLDMNWRDKQSANHVLGIGGFGSVHNSFIDLVFVTGLPGLLVFIFLLLSYFVKSIKYFTQRVFTHVGIFNIGILIGIIFFAYTGQAAFDKITWFMFGFIYMGFKLRLLA